MLGAPAPADIRNGSRAPAVAGELAARMAAAGIQVGAVTSTDDSTSGVQYADGQAAQAAVLAAALGVSGSEQLASVGHVTVVIGSEDSDRLLANPSIC